MPSCHSMPCHAMLMRHHHAVMPCHAVPCHAMPCRAHTHGMLMRHHHAVIPCHARTHGMLMRHRAVMPCPDHAESHGCADFGGGSSSSSRHDADLFAPCCATPAGSGWLGASPSLSRSWLQPPSGRKLPRISWQQCSKMQMLSCGSCGRRRRRRWPRLSRQRQRHGSRRSSSRHGEAGGSGY